MPQTNADKDTSILLAEILDGFANQTIKDKVIELQYRIIKEDDSDSIVQGGTEITKGGVRPKHIPIVPA